MCTGRLLTVCCSLLPGEGGSAWSGGMSVPRGGCLLRGVCSPGGGGVCLVWGGLPAWSGGVCLPGRGGLVPGGVCLPGPGGGSGARGVYPSMHWGRQPPPPCGQNSWHTLVKILPWPNFVAAGYELHSTNHSYLPLSSLTAPRWGTRWVAACILPIFYQNCNQRIWIISNCFQRLLI